MNLYDAYRVYPFVCVNLAICFAVLYPLWIPDIHFTTTQPDDSSNFLIGHHINVLPESAPNCLLNTAAIIMIVYSVISSALRTGINTLPVNLGIVFSKLGRKLEIAT